jgi:ABC-type uncharacterized transport system substrate-binding protein
VVGEITTTFEWNDSASGTPYPAGTLIDIQYADLMVSPVRTGLVPQLEKSNRLPAINNFPDFAQNGGLIGYGPELQSLFAQAGLLTRKVMQGAAIADLPVERPTRFRLVTDLKAARMIGVTMPTSLLRFWHLADISTLPPDVCIRG